MVETSANVGPRILLVGAGRFGRKHLDTLEVLHQRQALRLAGVVVRTKESAESLRASIEFPVFEELNDELLAAVDGVVVATPMATHADLVRRILPHAHVLVEKPLGVSDAETEDLVRFAQTQPRALMVGHTMRFDSTVMRLKEMIRRVDPLGVEISFIQPQNTDLGRDIELELLHPFDIVDFLFDDRRLIRKRTTRLTDRCQLVGAQYAENLHAVYRFGWAGEKKIRSIKLLADDLVVAADLLTGQIVTYKKGQIANAIDCSDPVTPLERELSHFLGVIGGETIEYPDANLGGRVVKTALEGRGRKAPDGRPRVAVIGAGIFGTNCALELSPGFDVTLFEKNDDICTEASKYNQYRHHWGYHYPRSQETIDDIAATIGPFEERYEAAVIRNFPTYYSVAKRGSKVSSAAYLAFCRDNDLAYHEDYPDERYLDRMKVGASLKTFEPIYDFKQLKTITADLLGASEAQLRFNSEIVGARIVQDGKILLVVKDGDGNTTEEVFDHVVNATYARHNHFLKWLGFPIKPIRIDLVEVAWVRLGIPKISFAVMDGPFTNMVSTKDDGLFTLVHIKHSVRKRFVPKDGLVPSDIFREIGSPVTEKVIRESAKWLPIVREAEVDSIHYVLRGVNAYREHDDMRTSDITEHGFGCYSILGGKIIHAVSVAREVARRINAQYS
ncbi:FAD-dependent oxidoreductase [Mycobacterium sp. IS-1264]|uniref:FAD-dependent oxidoreductase n=1 Tax=Mycobacterium sp. IS-1264 TaxID=1834158 RepID=UPI00147A4EAF|nr:FAD-dependent oxidoreductase [Mycobacterium sp. IS-1264]